MDELTVKAHVDNIFDTLPPYYITSTITRDILTAWVTEVDDANAANEDLIDQLYVPTATWGLKYWENDYEIIPAVGSDYETRRANVIAKMLGQGTFNKYSAKQLANAYSRAKTAEYFSIMYDDAFKTRHNIDDLISFSNLRAAFREMQPAHLQHIIGLLILNNMGPTTQTLEHIYAAYSETYPIDYKSKERIKLIGGLLGITEYDPADLSILRLNGSWKLDGTKTLDGVNHIGISLYIAAAETLRITVKQDGAVSEIATV